MAGKGLTVGEYLAQPTRSGCVERVADFCAVTGSCSWALLLALVALSVTWENGMARISLLVGLPSPFPVMAGLAVTGAALFAVCALIRLLNALGLARSRDDLGAVRRTLLHMMLSRPRFGVSPQTPMNSVGLTVRHMVAGGVKCRSRSVPFTPEDFFGVRAADFGGVDLVCVGGDLLVFPTVEAKKGYMKAINRKRRVHR